MIDALFIHYIPARRVQVLRIWGPEGVHLPEKMRGPVTERMRAAYHADAAFEAEALLTALAKELDKTHPGTAASLR